MILHQIYKKMSTIERFIEPNSSLSAKNFKKCQDKLLMKQKLWSCGRTSKRSCWKERGSTDSTLGSNLWAQSTKQISWITTPASRTLKTVWSNYSKKILTIRTPLLSSLKWPTSSQLAISSKKWWDRESGTLSVSQRLTTTSKKKSTKLGKGRRSSGKPSEISICKKKTVASIRISLKSSSVQPRNGLSRISVEEQVTTCRNSSLKKASTLSKKINSNSMLLRVTIWINHKGDRSLVLLVKAWARSTNRCRCSTNQRNLTRPRHRSRSSTSTSSWSSPHFKTWWKSCKSAWKTSGISWTQKPWTKFHKTFQLIKKRSSFGSQFKTSRTCNLRRFVTETTSTAWLQSKQRRWTTETKINE